MVTPNYDAVTAELYGRVDEWKESSNIVRYQLPDAFLGGSKATAKAIINALQAVVDAALLDWELQEVPF